LDVFPPLIPGFPPRFLVMKFRALQLCLVLVFSFLVRTKAQTNSTCDRGCLLKLLTIYTDGLQAKNVSAIPVAPTVRVTNNGVVTTIGTGIVWQTAGTLRLPYRHAVVDTVSGAATIQATVTNYTENSLTGEPTNATANNTVWYFYSLRLKVENSVITEVEELAGSAVFPGAPPASSLVWPDRIWDTLIPEDERATREELQTVANDYFSTVSGTIPWQQAPFHPECNRLEDADMTTNGLLFGGGCGTEFINPTARWNVTNRRFYIMDPVRGVVVAIAMFNPPTPSTVIMEQFKIENGLIRHVEAFYDLDGQAAGSGWDT
jgi:hypothetical protein